MPLKVSSQGWVKVAPAPRPRRRVDPEEQKEAFCSPLRYFACQAIDPSRERLRLLGGRAGFSSSEADLLRPHSRLERSSTLEEWRLDARPSRSSSRQSGNILENLNSPMIDRESGSGSHRSRRSGSEDENRLSGRSEDNTGQGEYQGDSRPRQHRRRDRASSTPLIIPVSPTPSVYDEAQESLTEEAVQVEHYPDNMSVAYSETMSERHCRHKHRHHQSKQAPSIIPEEEEPEPVATSIPPPATDAAPPSPSTTSEVCTRQHIEEKLHTSVSIPAPPPSVARSSTSRTHKTQVEIPSPIPESAPLEVPVKVASRAVSERSESPDRSDTRSERSEVSHRSKRSERSSRSSRSSRSISTYRSRRTESESDCSESVRSASPVRDQRYNYKDEDTSSYYPSPPPSPSPTTRRPRYEPQAIGTSSNKPRNRVVTAPVPTSKPSPALSASSWSSGSGSRSSASSVSSRSTSSAPSIDGYQFQAAIFQPKHYQGYRAPSLSKGNRWETATSALSFD